MLGGNSEFTPISSRDHSMDRPQCRRGIATGEDKGGNAGLSELHLQCARLASEPDQRAFMAQGARGRARLPRIDLVRRAQTGELGARGFECLDHLSYTDKAVAGCRLNAPCR